MSTHASPGRIPVTLLTGFLGSGKTTLLNHLVQQPELADALVIINEFGEMSLDHALVAHSTENLVMEMSNGCLCCTIRGDLVKTLSDITWRFSRNGERQFSRVLIETTGLADPTAIIHTLMMHPQVAPHYRLDGVVVTLDLATGMNTLDQHKEAVRQAAMADCLLLTKADLTTEEQRALLSRRLDSINPAAPRWEVRQGEIDAAKLLNLGLFSTQSKTLDVERWLQEEAYPTQKPPAQPSTFQPVHHHGRLHRSVLAPQAHQHHDPDVNRHDDHIRAFCFAVDDPISEALLMTWLDLLMQLVGSNILRVKGILNVQGYAEPMVIHCVQHIFHPPVSLPRWPSEDRRSRLVFITQDVGRDVIETTFHAFREVIPQAPETP